MLMEPYTLPFTVVYAIWLVSHVSSTHAEDLKTLSPNLHDSQKFISAIAWGSFLTVGGFFAFLVYLLCTGRTVCVCALERHFSRKELSVKAGSVAEHTPTPFR
jgi:hypothetical protein